MEAQISVWREIIESNVADIWITAKDVFEEASRQIVNISETHLGFNLPILYAQAALVVTLILVLRFVFSVVFSFKFWGTKSSKICKTKGDQILLLGQCDAGKTSLFFFLRNSKIPETVSSMKVNEDFIEIKDPFPNDKWGRRIKVVDFPGHQRMQPASLQLLPSAGCIIYLVDSSDKSHFKAVAENLFELLTSDAINQLAPPMLIVCNKSDLPTSRPVDQVKVALEREIERLRVSRSATLEGEDESESYLGVEGKAFDFSMSPCRVVFGSCSVRNKDVDDVVNFVCDTSL